MGENRPPRRPEVGTRPLSSGVQGLLSFGEPPENSFGLSGARSEQSSKSSEPSESSTSSESSELSSESSESSEQSEQSSESSEPSEQSSESSEPLPESRDDDRRSAASTSPVTVVRVLPDVVRLDKEFLYAVPDSWHGDGRAGRLAVGSIVRITLGGRPMRGWVTEVGAEPRSGFELQPLAKLTGMGPPADVVSLARWAAWRWAGRTVHLLRAASPPRVVTRPHVAPKVAEGREPLPQPNGLGAPRQAGDGLFDCSDSVTTLRLPPADDGTAVARAAARRGDSLIVVPTPADAHRIAADLRSRGVRVALGSDDWAVAASGATVVGTLTAVWLPLPRLAAVTVFDEHSEALRSERTPTWHAREVALERARRVGAPAVLVSPVPTLEAMEAGELLTTGRAAELDG